MSQIKYFNDNVSVENKRVILRLDLNVPMLDGSVKDTTRIDLSLPLINLLLKKKAKIIIISHLGRPKKDQKNDLSLLPVFNYLKEKIDTKFFFYTSEINKNTLKEISFLKKKEILFLENIRYQRGEIENDEVFAKNLASLGQIFINEAFSCSHRKQSSVHKITEFISEKYAGPLFKKEIDAINVIVKDNKKPITCIIGGSKVSSKIGVISSLIKKVDNIAIVGAMANNFLMFKGFKVGKSIIEKDAHLIVKKIYNLSKDNNCKIVIPEDCSVSQTMNGRSSIKDANQISTEDIILDIGPKSIKKILHLIDNSKTVLWNGPAGYFENENFALGTNSIANKISSNTINNSLLSIVGGGDTVSAIKNINFSLNFTHLSTAGGAFLEFLEGKNLPGIEVLK